MTLTFAVREFSSRRHLFGGLFAVRLCYKYDIVIRTGDGRMEDTAVSIQAPQESSNIRGSRHTEQHVHFEESEKSYFAHISIFGALNFATPSGHLTEGKVALYSCECVRCLTCSTPPTNEILI